MKNYFSLIQINEKISKLEHYDRKDQCWRR